VNAQSSSRRTNDITKHRPDRAHESLLALRRFLRSERLELRCALQFRQIKGERVKTLRFGKHTMNHSIKRASVVLAAAVAVLVTAGSAMAQEDYRVIRSFVPGPPNEGEGWPIAGLVKASDGNLYGATIDQFFKVAPDSTFTTIRRGVSFWWDPIQGGSDGGRPALRCARVVGSASREILPTHCGTVK
jgi:hypothetical protein